jgi:hypothetical protein
MSGACRHLIPLVLASAIVGCGSHEWKTFSPGDADWQVEAPGGSLVKGLDHPENEKHANRSQYSNFQFVEGRHQSFLLGEFPLDASARDLSLTDIVRQQIADRCADLGTPTATREISNGNLAGGEVDWTSKNGLERIRFLVAPDRGRVLIATAIIRGEETPERTAVARRFLESVRLKSDSSATTSPTPADSPTAAPPESVSKTEPAPSSETDTSSPAPAASTPSPSPRAAPTSPESQAIARLEAKGAQVFRGAGSDGNSASRVLVFSKPEFDDAACRDVAELREVQELMIEGTSVTDAGVAALGGLTKVVRMSLRNSTVGDAGLTSLRPLASLRSLDLIGTQVTPEGIAALKAAIPALDVMAPSAAVASAPGQPPAGSGPPTPSKTDDPASAPVAPGPQDPQTPAAPRPMPIVPGSPEHAVQQVVTKGAAGELEGLAAVIDPVATGLVGAMRDNTLSPTRKAYMQELFAQVRLVSNFEHRGGRVIVLANSFGQPLSFTCMQGDDRNYRVTELFIGPVPGRKK